jgi:hypothetical protein
MLLKHTEQRMLPILVLPLQDFLFIFELVKLSFLLGALLG